ncbi:ATP-binding protein [Agathobacter sp.]
MKLIACHINNFGKLSNLNINFNDGVNIINEPNGWGKSTLAAFLKAMLYGFDTKKEPGAFEKERKLYKPWQGGTYGGELDFETGGVAYRVVRTFGLTEKQDDFHLYRLKTMVECDDFSNMLGEELFDLDRNSFKRTIYIAQADCMFAPSDGINAKLGNLAENTNDINNFETASADIKDMMNKLSPNRITGSIKKRVNTITAIEQDLKKYQAAEDAAEQLAGKIDEKNAQKKELMNIRAEYGKALQVASAESRKQALRANYEQICHTVEEKEKLYNESIGQFHGNMPSEADLRDKMRQANDLDSLCAVERNLDFSQEDEQYIDELSTVFKEGVPSDDGLDEMQKKIANIAAVKNEYGRMELKLSQMQSLAMMADDEEEPKRPEKTRLVPGGIAVMIVGLVAAAIAAIFSLNEKYNVMEIMLLVIGVVGVLMALSGVVMLVAGVRKNNKQQRAYIRKMAEREENKKQKETPIKELKEQLEQIQSGITTMESEVSQFYDRFGMEAQPDQYQEKLFELRSKAHDYNRFTEQISKKAKTKADRQKLESEIEAYLEEYGCDPKEDYTQSLSRLKSSLAECGFAKENLDNARTKKEQFETENDMENILSADECPYSLDELNDMISKVETSLEDIRASLTQYARQMDDLQEQLDMRDEKEQEYRNCQQIQAEEKHKYEILKLTSDYLLKAKEQFTARYMAPIANGFQKYFGILTENTDCNWQVDANISLKVKEQGQLRDVRTMSAGYQDLIGICMRFALVDAMYPGEKPFLILDDPFVNLDDEKLARGKQMLIALEREYQVIYFTCHGSREYSETK